ncbi:MAG: DEAD/DEAH box helicase [Alphaproteobacteria bacterium]|nr:MAG: DEAD/DEAH box helicase [Alphaproteobacteria bacterium]
MLLRPRQKIFVENCVAALKQRRNTLGVAPTGAGKTIMLSAATGEILREMGGKAAILAHRDELTAQNVTKFARVNPGLTTSIYDANSKSWHGRATFAMVPTLARQDNLSRMPHLDLLVIDEAHHAAATSYLRIIEEAKAKNPNLMLFGLTATPNRGDQKALRPIFDNVGDQIRLAELIKSGHLVPPRTFVVDVGVQEDLKKVRKTAIDFDMNEVEEIMNRPVVTGAVVRHWQEQAHDRKTVVFCSTIVHAENVRQTFQNNGVEAVIVHGEMANSDRRLALARFQQGSARVIVNVAVLTEGWDYPPTSCVLLLRPSSYKSTMIQMVGRGLRTIDPKEHPGVIKTDCIVLDFGTSTLMHGSLEQDVNLDGKTVQGDAPTKECPECCAILPLSAQECALCGFEFLSSAATGEAGAGDEEPLPLENFSLTEIDLLKRSSFRWIDLFDDDAALMASGFSAWAAIFWLGGYWHAVGGFERAVQILGTGERVVMMAVADDFLNEHETSESAHKTRRWMNEPASEKQLALLGETARMDFSMTKYRASCLLNFRFNKGRIRQLVEQAVGNREAA